MSHLGTRSAVHPKAIPLYIQPSSPPESHSPHPTHHSPVQPKTPYTPLTFRACCRRLPFTSFKSFTQKPFLYTSSLPVLQEATHHSPVQPFSQKPFLYTSSLPVLQKATHLSPFSLSAKSHSSIHPAFQSSRKPITRHPTPYSPLPQ